jgi:serine/threonine protein kinase
MAPEIIKGEDPTPASDLYAVGVILYQLLTGRTPFYGRTDFEVMKSHLEKEPQPPETLNPNLPPGTWDLVKKALAKSPKERFSSADEFKQALIDWFSRVEDPQKIKSVDLTNLQSFQVNNVKKVAINKKYVLIGLLSLLIISLSLIVVLLLSQRKEKPKDVPGLLKIDTPPAQPIQASPPKQEHQTTTSPTGIDKEKQEKTQQGKPQEEIEKPKKQVGSGTDKKTTQENQTKGEDKRVEDKTRRTQPKGEDKRAQKRGKAKRKPTERRRRSKMGSYKVISMLAFVALLSSCSEQVQTSFKIAYEKALIAGRTPGEKLLNTYQDVSQGKECKDVRGIKVIENGVVPSVVEKGEKINHRIIYLVCQPTSIKGSIVRMVKKDGKALLKDDTPYEFKPGKWAVDAFIVVPSGVESGSYVFESLIDAEDKKFSNSLPFIVK